MKKINRGLFVTVSISLGMLFFLYILSSFTFVERISNLVNDTFTYRLQYTQNRHNDDIVIIKIDDKTLDNLGKSDLGMVAFDKGVYAELIEKVFSGYKAGALGIDIVFANPSVLGVADEQKLARALAKYKDRVVIASRSDYKPHPLCLYSSVQHGGVDIIQQDKMRVFSVVPFPYNLSSLCPDSQIYEGNNESISTFSREVLDIYAKQIDPFTRQTIDKNLEIFDENQQTAAHIDYYSNGKVNDDTFGFESYSFIDIYKGLRETSKGQEIDLEGKIVLLGEVGTLIHDSHFTPIHNSAKMPGIEINANIITTMMTGRNLRDISLPTMFLLFFLLQVGMILSALYLRISLAFMVLFISIGMLLILGGWMFVIGHILDIFLGIIGCILSLLIAYIYKFQVTDKAKRSLKKQFSSYVSPEVVNEISQNPDSILVRGEKRNMSIFFSDIVSFTGISEKYDAEVIVEILNEYFSEMTKIIYNNKGTLDKYIGDAVMCFFNAPLKQENHSFFACRSALEQQKRLRELNHEWQKKEYPEIKIRIGIHTGEAIHGNIGSSDTRVNYTVIGDSVNLAARLEGVCKQYGISICVSQDVYQLQKDAFYFRELDVIEVKGRQAPVKIFQLLGDKKLPLSPKHLEYLERYKEALDAYQKEDFMRAQVLFMQNKGDETSSIMGKRCQDIQDGISRLNQGVFQLHTK